MNTFQNIFFILYKKYKLNLYDVLILNYLYTIQYSSSFNYVKKFKLLKKYIINNKLLNNSDKYNLFNLFFESQKYYHILIKFTHRYKFRKALFFQNDSDLMGNNLIDLNKNLTLIIYESSSNLKYLFRISDIINIINNSLCNLNNFTITINDIKNPYTNIEFSKTTLYNIYFELNKSTFIMPKLFHLYFLNNFDNNIFKIQNNSIITQYLLTNYIKNINNFEKINIIKQMLYDFKDIIIFPNTNILNDDQKLVDVFEYCINDYIFLNHSNNLIFMREAKENLQVKLFHISKKNIYSNLLIYNKIDQILENFIFNTLLTLINKLQININFHILNYFIYEST